MAALPREIAPLVRGWRREILDRDVAGNVSTYVFEGNRALAGCAGMGAERVTYAAEALVQRGATMLVSVGYAGGLSERASCGTVFVPSTVIDASTGERFRTGIGSGTLVSVGFVAGTQSKRELAQRYGGDLVDMEAAAVARQAERRGVEFYAVKAISDTRDARMPEMSRFNRNGQFRTGLFLVYMTVRPWMWPVVARLGMDARRAVAALNDELERWVEAGGPPETLPNCRIADVKQQQS